MPMRNIVGNVPEPGELYGRDDLLAHLWRQIEGNNLLLLAPRRFGKTGVMNHVYECPREGWLPLYLDLEDVDSVSEFLWRMTQEILSRSQLRSLLHRARGLPRTISSWARDTFDEMEFAGAKVKFKENLPCRWRPGARQLMLELEKAEPRLIFIFDELPTMLDRIREKEGEGVARVFLSWFRSMRLERGDRLRRHRFLAGGSTGIDLVLRGLGVASAMNDFERLYVEPLDDEDAEKLARDLAKSLDVSFAGVEAGDLLALLGPPVPYFIHMLFSQIAQLPPATRRALDLANVERTYRRRVLGPTCKHYFDDYRSRLARYGKARESCAMAILKAVAERGRMSSSAVFDLYLKARGRGAGDTEFAELMADLECDWYLLLDVRTNEYRFQVQVMRDWWTRWYGITGRKPGPAGTV